MEYRHIEGPVYCRYAFTPPVVNSDFAHKYGLEAPSVVDLDQGSNVKLRIILATPKKRMTCHAKIDYVKENQETGEYTIGFSQLSLSDKEFKELIKNFTDISRKTVEFGRSVRDKAFETEPLTTGELMEEIERIKAISLPVSIIEAIDMKRGDVSFSKYIVDILKENI